MVRDGKVERNGSFFQIEIYGEWLKEMIHFS